MGDHTVTTSRETVERCIAAWLETFPNPTTRQAYRRRLWTWLRWCAERRVAPLAAEADEIDLFAVSRASGTTIRGTILGWYRWLAMNPITGAHALVLESDDLQQRCTRDGCTNVPAVDQGTLCLNCIDDVYRNARLRRFERYTNYATAVAVGCLECPWTGHISLALLLKPGRAANLPGCRSCSYRRRGERRRTPADEAYQEFWDAGYEMVGKFTGVDDPVDAICLEHQLPCRPRLKHVRTRGDRSCTACSNRAKSERMRKYSQEDIRQLLLGGNMEKIGTFRTVAEPILARCLTPTCRKESRIWIATIRRGGTCRFCAKRKAAAPQRLDPAVVEKAVNEAGFDLLSEYVNNHTLMQLRCRRCTRVFPRPYKSLHKGSRRCPGCDPTPPSRPMLEQEEVRAEYLTHGLRMTGTYTGSNNPVAAECITCGNTDCKPTLGNLRSGQGGCRICGNQKIADALRTPLDAVIAIMDAAGIDFIGPFRSQTARTRGRHRSCGTVVTPRINSLVFGGGGCTACGYAKRRVPWASARDVAGYLYLLDFNLDGERFCKVGIGKVDSGRIEQFKTHCDARVRQVVTASLADCYAAEQAILVDHRGHAYVPINPCLVSGHTECMYHYVRINLQRWLPGS
jgi:hypothetical protein